ncbi:MAG: DUF3987 domain-containing protein [Planctomycetes bacterium]|nr:DUF3987 domain-containing protein [Planctomycetota bacterium]
MTHEVCHQTRFLGRWICLTVTDGALQPIPITLDNQAKSLWIKFFNKHAEEQTLLTGDLAAAWSKLEGCCARIALVIHLLKEASGEPVNKRRIDRPSMKSSIILIEWFKQEYHNFLTDQSPDWILKRRRIEVKVLGK